MSDELNGRWRLRVNSVLKSKLGRRILLLVLFSMIFMLVGLTVSGWVAVQKTSNQTLSERKYLAESTADYLDYILKQNLARIDGASTSSINILADSEIEPKKQVLHNIYVGSVFQCVFLTDQLGNVLWVEPYRTDLINQNLGRYSFTLQSLTEKKPGVSNILEIGQNEEKAILVVSPVKTNDGSVLGLIGGWLDPSAKFLQDLTRNKVQGKTSYTDIVDANQVVINSSSASRVLRDTATANSGTSVVTSVAPISAARWTIVVGQSRGEATALENSMRFQFGIIGLFALALALFLAWGAARSLIVPINKLSESAYNISRGDLSHPLPELGKDEIGKLGQSFDTMRETLRRSLEQINNWNKELELKVEDRTRRLEESYRQIEQKDADRSRLLGKVLSAQEDERKRIARELHDETIQSLVGLVMRIEAMTAANSLDKTTRTRLADIKGLAVRTIDSIHNIIFDLRPSILDDLGLLPGVRWYAENRLSSTGIKVRVEVTGEERKLPSHIEIALFRVVQEALTNIIKHAEASNVVLSFEFTQSSVAIEVEDDGKGFDMKEMLLPANEKRGVGLLGMRERVSLLGGEIVIRSQPGGGTHISLEVPDQPQGVKNA